MVSLLLIVIQDLKYRHIHVFLPLVIFVVALCFLYIKGLRDYTIPIYNIGFFILIFTVLIIYMSIKNKSYLNPFTHYFGLGDVLYFIAITPFFVLHNYILFFIFSMLFAIVLKLLFKSKMKNDSIPLAGFSALLLLLFIGSDLLFNHQHFTLIG